MSPTLTDLEPTAAFTRAGFRFGDRGTHTSRTMMLAELTDLLAAVPAEATRADYSAAIVDDNLLGKSTSATRRLTNQRLGELYGLERELPLFRVLRRLWSIDVRGRPLLALLCALARDPLLRSTARVVLELPEGSELTRATLLDAIRDAVGTRLNESILDKVARNAASTWAQAGHLQGRVRKLRRRVSPTPGSAALALWMGSLENLAGRQLLECRWARVLDHSGPQLVDSVLQAKQLGLIHARIGGGVIEIGASMLDKPQREL